MNDCQREVYGSTGSDYRKKVCYKDACEFPNRRGIPIRYDCGDYGDHKDNSKYYYYAIAIGRNPGIYHMSWCDCKDEVCGFPGAEYRRYSCRHDARSFMRRRCPLEEYSEYSDDEDEYGSTDSSNDADNSETSSSEYSFEESH